MLENVYSDMLTSNVMNGKGVKECVFEIFQNYWFFRFFNELQKSYVSYSCQKKKKKKLFLNSILLDYISNLHSRKIKTAIGEGGGGMLLMNFVLC